MKFMNMKRFASTTMAGVMALSLAVPAMAVDQSTVITATYAETTLDVTVPANTNATINPYGLPVTMEDAKTVLSGQPITIPTPLMIENKSAVALKVGASVKTEVTTGITLETAGNKGTVAGGTAKAIYAEFQAFEAAGIDGTTAADITKTNPAWAALKDEKAVLKAVLATGATAVEATPVVTGTDLVLREGKDGLAQAGGVAYVRLSGVVAKKPTTAWATTDKLTATITYSFEPAVYAKSAGTIAGGAGLTSGGTTSSVLTLTPNLPTGVTVSAWTWVSGEPAAATVTAQTDTTKANVAYVADSTTADKKVTVTVSGVGSDGITYSATTEFTVG